MVRRRTAPPERQLKIGEKLKGEHNRFEVVIVEPESGLTAIVPNLVARVTYAWGDSSKKWIQVRRRTPNIDPDLSITGYTEEVVIPPTLTDDPDTTLMERMGEILPTDFTMRRRL